MKFKSHKLIHHSLLKSCLEESSDCSLNMFFRVYCHTHHGNFRKYICILNYFFLPECILKFRYIECCSFPPDLYSSNICYLVIPRSRKCLVTHYVALLLFSITDMLLIKHNFPTVTAYLPEILLWSDSDIFPILRDLTH